jgi:hypothetical protein
MCIDCLFAEFEPDPAREYRVVEADMIFTRRAASEGRSDAQREGCSDD